MKNKYVKSFEHFKIHSITPRFQEFLALSSQSLSQGGGGHPSVGPDPGSFRLVYQRYMVNVPGSKPFTSGGLFHYCP